MKHNDLLAEMTLEEKAGLCSGLDYWHTKPIERLGVPSVMLSDGPHGLRRHPGDTQTKDKRRPLPAVCFPLACLSACSWDRDLIYAMGKAIGEEALEQNVAVVLGPGVNIKRSPLCGRNFEYFSEDPYLSGEIGTAWINGVQAMGVGTSVKHFAANSQEAFRMTSDSVVDERALREIYLTAFEKAVKQARPWTVMSAYNKLNGTYCTENAWILTKVLREEWGFDGIVVCDWGAENDRVAGICAGNDLEMPSSNGIGDRAVVEAVKNGVLDEAALDACTDRMLDLIFRSAKNDGTDARLTKADEHHCLARRIAAASMVLLKNEDHILPLRRNAHIAVIGEMAKAPRCQGSGSSQVNPTKIDNFCDEAAKAGLCITYAQGYRKTEDEPNAKLLEEAKQTAKNADVVLLFVGLTESYEAEASDRTHLSLPPSHTKLIREVCKVNPNVAVILSGGAPVEMPWADGVKGILNTYLAGQAGAGAIVDIVTGKANPSGKLAETYPKALSDVPCAAYYPNRYAPYYKESVFVGYRYYDTAQKEVLFPFGHGLSYTTFAYGDLKVTPDAEKKTVAVSFQITNTGETDGAEVAQVYVQAQNSAVFRPSKELKGFQKVFLKAGESKTVTVELDERAFAFYNVQAHAWHVEQCPYTIAVGASSRDIRLQENLTLPFFDTYAIPDYRESASSYYSGDVQNISDAQFQAVYGKALPAQSGDPNKPLDLNSTFSDGKDVPAVRAMRKIIRFAMRCSAPNDLQAQVAYNSVMAVPIRTIISMSQGVVSPEIAQGMVDILDGKGVAKPLLHILKGLTKTVKNLPKLLSTVS